VTSTTRPQTPVSVEYVWNGVYAGSTSQQETTVLEMKRRTAALLAPTTLDLYAGSAGRSG